MDKKAAKKALIVYSGKSVEKLANAIAEAIGDACETAKAEDAPNPAKYAFAILAFETQKGWPDGCMRALMRKCRCQDLAIIASPDGNRSLEETAKILGRVEGLLDSCRVKAEIVCGENGSEAVEATLKAWREVLSGESEKKEKKAMLLAAFGTSSEKAKNAYGCIERIAAEANPGIELRWAFSSGMVRAKLKKRGERCKPAAEALDELLREGYNSVDILPLYLTPGEECHKLLNDIAAFRNAARGFKRIRVGKPLLNSAESLLALCEAAISSAPQERDKNDALVFMGHGNTDGRSDILYIAAAHELSRLDKKAFLGCVEGKPDFDCVREQIKASGAKKAFLIPFMVVAGDHAINDMAGDEPGSWKSQLQADGVECHCLLKGLGENAKAAKIFLDGLAES